MKGWVVLLPCNNEAHKFSLRVFLCSPTLQESSTSSLLNPTSLWGRLHSFCTQKTKTTLTGLSDSIQEEVRTNGLLVSLLALVLKITQQAEMPWSFTHVSCSGPSPYLSPQMATLRNTHMTEGLALSQQITRSLHTARARQGGSPSKLLSGRKSKISAYLLLWDAEVALSLEGWGGTVLLREAREHRLHYSPHGHTGKLKLMQSTRLIKANWHVSEITLPCSWGKPDCGKAASSEEVTALSYSAQHLRAVLRER